MSGRLCAREEERRHFFHHNHDNLVVFHARSLSLSLSLSADIIRIPDRNFHLLSPSPPPSSFFLAAVQMRIESICPSFGGAQKGRRSVARREMTCRQQWKKPDRQRVSD